MSTPRQAEYDIDPAFLSRWSRRSFTGEAITDKELFTLFEAARWAPSGSNSQPWRFVYARNGSQGWPAILGALNERNQIWAGKASVLIAVISTPTFKRPNGEDAQSRSHSFDAGAAWGALGLQAHKLGLAARAMGGVDFKKLQESIGVPEGYRIEAVVAVGHPGEASLLPADFQSQEQPTGRHPQSQFVFEGAFKG